jgi:enoyl-CoA hydratase
MNYKNLIVEIKNKIAVLTFNRPQVLNAMNTETVAELGNAITKMESDDQIAVVVLTGAGRAFIAGADIAEMSSKTPEQARHYSKLGHTVMHRLETLKKPVIAAVNGYALGGGVEVLLSCDISIASDQAKFGLPETILGAIPGWGATQRAARLVGITRTKQLIFTGEIIDARTAYEFGLINRIVPHDQLMQAVMDMAQKISMQGPCALAEAKKTINEGIEKTLEDGCKLEINAFCRLFATEDQKEGMKAFLEKRKPCFTGK